MTRWSKALLCGATALLTLETSARLDDFFCYDAPLLGTYSIDNIYDFGHLGKRGRPNGRYQKWRLNSLGLRGPELQPERIRIASIGASETFGMNESPGSEYPRQLERELNARAGRETYQVVNCSYPGLSLPTAIQVLPPILDAVGPALVIIYPTPAQYINRRVEQPVAPEESPRRFELRVRGKALERIKSALPSTVRNQLCRLAIGRAVAMYGPAMARVPDDRIRFCRVDLEKLISLLRARGIQPVLVTHVTRFGSFPSQQERQLLVNWRRFYPLLEEAGFLDAERRVNELVRDVARRQNATLIDAAAKMPSGMRYFGDFVHFTDEGARAFAAIIADGLGAVQSPGFELAQTGPRSLQHCEPNDGRRYTGTDANSNNLSP